MLRIIYKIFVFIHGSRKEGWQIKTALTYFSHLPFGDGDDFTYFVQSSFALAFWSL